MRSLEQLKTDIVAAKAELFHLQTILETSRKLGVGYQDQLTPVCYFVKNQPLFQRIIEHYMDEIRLKLGRDLVLEMKMEALNASNVGKH